MSESDALKESPDTVYHLMVKLQWKPQETGNAKMIGCLPRITACMELSWSKKEGIYAAGG